MTLHPCFQPAFPQLPIITPLHLQTLKDPMSTFHFSNHRKLHPYGVENTGISIFKENRSPKCLTLISPHFGNAKNILIFFFSQKDQDSTNLTQRQKNKMQYSLSEAM